jgi:RNA polymerase sigma factor for flagellar operon FliA
LDNCEQVLWEKWRGEHDTAARNALVIIYSPWARMVARDVYMRVHSLADAWHDCVQNALIGLMEAMERFDSNRGVAFQTFARYRVRGAVFNGLRHLRESLAQGVAPDTFISKMIDRVASLDDEDQQGSFDAFVDTTIGLGLGFLLESRSFPGAAETADAYGELEREELSTAVVKGVAQLDAREQMILTMHYYHHVPFVEIASRMGVTKGRVSQLHKRALLNLRATLGSRVLADY